MRTRWVALIALVVLAAACGTQLDDQERAAYLPSALTGVSTGAAGAVDTAAGSVPAAESVGGTTTTTLAGGAAVPAGATAAAASSGTAACAAPTREEGVTDSTITLGGVFQLSGPVTGFAEQFLTGVRAKVAQVNASGGICGRKLAYLSRDDGFDAARNASQTRDLIPRVLSIAGSFSTVDNGGASVLAGTNVPVVTSAATPEAASLPNYVSHSHFPEEGMRGPEWGWFHSRGVTKAALVYVSLASARHLMDITEHSMAAAGIQVVKRIELSPTQFSYDGAARETKGSGAQLMFFLHEVNAASAMAEALARTPGDLPFPYYSTFSYGKHFLELAGASAEGSYTLVPFVPFEEAGANPPTQELMHWIDQVDPGAAPTFDAANGWTTMTLLMDALKQLKGPITRASVLASLKTIQDFDGHGVWGPAHPNDRRSSPCLVVLRVKGGKWVREAPAKGFLC